MHPGSFVPFDHTLALEPMDPQHAFLSPGCPIERVNQPEGFKLVGQDSSDSREGFASASTEGNAHVRREAVAWNTDDDNTARRMSLASGIVLIAFFGQQMTWWLAQIISINDEFVGRFAIESGVGDYSYVPNWIGYTIMNSVAAISILALTAGETWRATKKGINGFTVVIYMILGVGLISGIADYAILGIVDSCMYTVCEDFPKSYDIWYNFTTDALVLLFTPLMVMYLLLHFDVIDSAAENNQWMTRIIVILMLLIVSSTMIELLQSILPVSDMISSAILAMVVAIFIGWEERIMKALIAEGESISKKLQALNELNEPEIQDSDLELFSKSMAVLTGFIFILCILYSSIV